MKLWLSEKTTHSPLGQIVEGAALGVNPAPSSFEQTSLIKMKYVVSIIESCQHLLRYRRGHTFTHKIYTNVYALNVFLLNFYNIGIVHKLLCRQARGGGFAKLSMVHSYYISLCSKLVYEGGRGIKNPQNLVKGACTNHVDKRGGRGVVLLR